MCRISLGANCSTKCPEKAGPASALGYGQAIDQERGAPFCIPLGFGGASARLIADS
jgi:hypothetical protein